MICGIAPDPALCHHGALSIGVTDDHVDSTPGSGFVAYGRLADIQLRDGAERLQ